LLRGFDVAYFSDWANVGFHTIRSRRFLGKAAAPICVTMMHGPSAWIRFCEQQYPFVPDDLYVEFIEQYAAVNSDFTIAPSRFIVNWAKKQGWKFRSEPEVLGLPYRPEIRRQKPNATAPQLKRLIFFGRLQTHKGYELFVRGLRTLAKESPDVLSRLEQISLLGHEDVPGAVSWIRDQVAEIGLPVEHFGSFDSQSALDYLARNAAETLVVIPSPIENFPYAVIETSLIEGLNVIFSAGGGTSEIFGSDGETQYFAPTPQALAVKLAERLTTSLSPGELMRYHFEAANQRWLEFHSRVCDHARSSRTTVIPAPSVENKPAVDVCVTYYNKQRYFSQLCESLELQTCQDFRVIAIDDGSSEAEAREAFDSIAEKYRSAQWTFLHQSNRYVDAARNAAARRADAEYLLMVDADDVLAPNAIELMLTAIRLSDDDCLVTYSYSFAGDEFPYDRKTGELLVPARSYIRPLGAALVAAMVEPWVLGGPMIIIRRRVFEAIGGYHELRDAGHEDWEMHIRLTMAGYRTDVIPEFLHYYRVVDDGLARSFVDFTAKQRIIDTFDRRMAQVGLSGAANAMYALYRQWRGAEDNNTIETKKLSDKKAIRLLSDIEKLDPRKPG
jgi:glycosyltransferase involved in cell wall biosynthesis